MTNKEARLALHDILTKILGNGNVYYQPPDGIKMSYPCIRYSLDGEDTFNANDKTFIKKRQYTVMVITKDPDSEIPDRIDELEYSSFERSYKSDNLYHFVYTIYY